MLVNSVPLSLTIIAGRDRSAIAQSSSRATRTPENRGVGDEPDALAGEVVDHRKDPEPPTAGERVGHEVQRPALVAALRDRHRRPDAERPLATAATPHGQPLLAVKSEQLLVVQLDTFAPEQNV